jgi:hypothetical protein
MLDKRFILILVPGNLEKKVVYSKYILKSLIYINKSRNISYDFKVTAIDFVWAQFAVKIFVLVSVCIINHI